MTWHRGLHSRVGTGTENRTVPSGDWIRRILPAPHGPGPDHVLALTGI